MDKLIQKNSKPKKELAVYTRFSDKVTFIALVIGVAFSFIIGIVVYAYEFAQTMEFWEGASECIAKQEFKCMLEIRSDQGINKDLMISALGLNITYLGCIFGTLAVLLYKTVKYVEKK